MCGIAGVVQLDGTEASLDLARAMAETIVHRGPDEGGAVSLAEVALSHRRLNIIDLETGQQPMRSASGRTVIAYNGEVYNFRTLRERLLGLGQEFATSSDTEVVLAAYEQWGTLAFDRLEGIFAFALVDLERRSRARTG